jgi:hypothetical protein
MDLGFVTHAVHANSRLVFVPTAASRDGSLLSITAPPNAGTYPPGPTFLFVVVDGIPSEAIKLILGDGASPPHD